MGKHKVKLNIDGDRLRAILDGKITLTELAAICGVTKQAFGQWLTDGEMRPRMLAEIVMAADLTKDQLEEVLAPQAEKKKIKITITVEDS